MIVNFHLSDGGMACHVGGEVDNSTYPIHIPDEMLPKPIQEFLKNGQYMTMSLSYTKDSDMTQVLTSMPNPNIGKYLEALETANSEEKK